MRPAIAILLVLLTGACLPQTRLAPPPSQEEGAGTGPAALTVALVEPTPGGLAPQNLAAVVLRMPAALRESGGAAQLRPGGGSPVALGQAAPVECTGPGRCYGFALSSPLPPGRYAVTGPAGARLEDGRALPALTAGAFDVEAELDRTPPVVDPPLLDTVGDCLRARFATDEPARASLLVRAGGLEQRLAAGEGSTLFDLATRLERLPPGASGELVITAVDWAGNRSESVPVPMKVPPAALPLAITEVLLNPAGPEATQEFIELRNLGVAPISLEGMTLEDAGGADPLPAVTLAPGAFAVVVAAAFDPADGRDPAPREGVMLLKVEGKLGRDGIGNAAEAVRLRTGTGEVISRYGGWIDASAAAWTGHSVQRQPPDACDGPAAWNPRPQAPTPGW